MTLLNICATHCSFQAHTTVEDSLVLFAIICQNEILELHFHLDPLLVGERWPDVMRLRDGGLVRFQDHFGAVIVDVEGSQDQDKSREGLKIRVGQ